MWSWIVIGALYVLVFGGFRILGGMSSAMDALRDWGRASASGARPTPSSS
jgi:Sec-independent protein translocase protein TatA